MRRFLAKLIVSLMFMFAISVVAADSLVVMDRGYYDTLHDSFNSECVHLYTDVQGSFTAMRSWLNTIQSALETSYQEVVDARNQLYSQGINGGLTQVDEQRRQLALTSLESVISDTSALRSRINNYHTSLNSNQAKVLNDIHAVSNSFPVEISTTNLNLEIYVIVTNNFECTNDLSEIRADYTNFLNYFDGAIDGELDQYRATVTNLLDWSEFSNWLNYSRWRWGSSVDSTRVLSPYNIAWDSVQLNNTGYGYVLNSGASNVRYWRYYWYSLPLDATFSDYLTFNLQGIHDTIEQLGKIQYSNYYGLIVPASTNLVMSYPLSSSAKSQMADFLAAESNYSNQVSKLSASRNWYQRIEHWLSYIALSTSKQEAEISDSSSRLEQLSSTTNDVVSMTVGISNHYAYAEQRVSRTMEVITNTFGSVVSMLNAFTPEDSSKKGPSANDYTALKFMDVQFVADRLSDLTGKGNSIPTSLVISDDVFNQAVGNGGKKSAGVTRIEAFSKMGLLVQIGHVVFGVLWVLISFGVAIILSISTVKAFGNLWWRALKFIPDVARYTFGQ